MRPLATAVAAGLWLAVAMPAAAAPGEVPDDAYRALAADLVRHHVVPGYRALATATAGLADAATAACAEPTRAAADGRLRAAFDAATDAWMGVQHLRFGPVELFMRGYRIQFWPRGQGKVDDAVAEALAALAPGVPSPDRFREASVAVQGLPAAEYLIFDDASPLADPERADAGCRLLQAIAANLAGMAVALVDDWTRGDAAFAAAMREPGPDNVYFETPQEAALAFFRSLYGGLQLIADVKLMPVAGKDIGAARPALAESAVSRRSARNIVGNLEALRQLYLGSAGGFSALVAAHGADAGLDALLRKAFDQTLANAEALPVPLERAVLDPAHRPQVEKLLLQARALKQIVRTRLAEAAGLSVGFNALDGD